MKNVNKALQESNILLAEFVGYVYKPSKGFWRDLFSAYGGNHYWHKYSKVAVKVSWIKNCFHHWENIDYVLKVIQKLGANTTLSYNSRTKEYSLMIHYFNKELFLSYGYTTTSLNELEAIYRGCVEFVKFFNKQLQNDKIPSQRNWTVS